MHRTYIESFDHTTCNALRNGATPFTSASLHFSGETEQQQTGCATVFEKRDTWEMVFDGFGNAIPTAAGFASAPDPCTPSQSSSSSHLHTARHTHIISSGGGEGKVERERGERREGEGGRGGWVGEGRGADGNKGEGGKEGYGSWRGTLHFANLRSADRFYDFSLKLELDTALQYFSTWCNGPVTITVGGVVNRA